ncbi:MAG: hypothetical protein B7Y40_08485 [Gammaproteobacteria bacterium 28-57-27]|nr:MAG: hypothetical protein B7Y40_08485 [Gammaproteobacteria bacterium 28-57-27]
MGRVLVQILIGLIAAIVAVAALLSFTSKRKAEREALQTLEREKAELERALEEKQINPPPPSPTKKHRFWVWLYSNGNLLGSALALVGLGLYFGGLIGDIWWLIVPGLYAAGYLIAPQPPRRQDSLSQAQVDLHEALDELQRRAHNGLTAERLETFDRLIASLRDTLPLLEQQALGDRSAYTLRQTILDYLPATLDNYLRLPKAYRQMHKLKDGRTPRQVFVTQLNTLNDEVQSSLAALAENDMQQLLANERFLADRFSRPESF